MFCGCFGFLFLVVFQPFNLATWFQQVDAPLPAILTFFICAGMAALALTQFALRPLFKIKSITRIGFISWFFLEYLLISLAAHSINIYLLDVSFYNGAEFVATLKYTLLILMLPYFLGLLLLYLERQFYKIRELEHKIRKPPLEFLTIPDEQGRLVAQVPVKNILYLKSEDNYVELFYKSDGTIRKQLIRTTLKKLEETLDPERVIRIHRSYMVNRLTLDSVVKTQKGYVVRMESVAVDLPVSTTYLKNLLR